jgi:hypothetical protein
MISKIKKQAEHIESEKDASHAIKTACDSGTIKQKIIHIEDLQKLLTRYILKRPFIQYLGEF